MNFHYLSVSRLTASSSILQLEVLLLRKNFSDVCNATKCKSENYKLQKEWKDTIAPKYKEILMNLNKGGILTFEMVRQCIMGEEVVLSKEDITQSQSFISIHYCPRRSFNISKSNKLIVTHQN